jgi:hypothetical protein
MQSVRALHPRSCDATQWAIRISAFDGIFFRGKFFVFLQGFLGKTGGRVWFFDGEFVVDGVIIVVN